MNPNDIPAFPTLTKLGDMALSEGGLSIRDCFAALAMQAYLTHESGSNAMPSTVAGWAFEMADAMLKARLA